MITGNRGLMLNFKEGALKVVITFKEGS